MIHSNSQCTDVPCCSVSAFRNADISRRLQRTRDNGGNRRNRRRGSSVPQSLSQHNPSKANRLVNDYRQLAVRPRRRAAEERVIRPGRRRSAVSSNSKDARCFAVASEQEKTAARAAQGRRARGPNFPLRLCSFTARDDEADRRETIVVILSGAEPAPLP